MVTKLKSHVHGNIENVALDEDIAVAVCVVHDSLDERGLDDTPLLVPRLKVRVGKLDRNACQLRRSIFDTLKDAIKVNIGVAADEADIWQARLNGSFGAERRHGTSNFQAKNIQVRPGSRQLHAKTAPCAPDIEMER